MRPLTLLALIGALAALDAPIVGTSVRVPLPEGFTITRLRDGFVAARPGVPVRIAGLSAALPPETGPAAFARASFDDLGRLTPDLTLINATFADTRGPRLWSRLRYRCRIDGRVWVQETWLTVDQGRGVVVTMSVGDGQEGWLDRTAEHLLQRSW